MRQSHRPGILLAGVLIGFAAAEASTPDFEEVVVTARRRAEPLASSPISAAVFARSDLERLQAANVADLARGLVGVRFDAVGPQGRSGQFAIRGISYGSTNQAGDPSIPLYVDGVYQSRSNLAMLRQFDLQSAEVVRGPQVTYLGRNAFAGAITLQTRQPGDRLAGQMEVGTGNYGARRWLAAVDLPLKSFDSAFRVAATGVRSDGFHRSASRPERSLGGEDFHAARLTWRMRLDGNWLLTLKAEVLRDRGEPSPLRNASTTPDTATSRLPAQVLGSIPAVTPNHFRLPTFRTELFQPAGQRSFVDQESLTLASRRPLGTGVLDVVVARQRTDDSVVVDPAAVGNRPYNNQYFVTDMRMDSHEVRWLGEAGTEFQWLLGAHHLHDEMNYGNITLSEYAPLLGSNAQVLAGQQRRSTSTFAEVEWRPQSAWRINLAGRLMREDKTFRFARTPRPPAAGTPPDVFLSPSAFASRAATWKNFSPRFSVDYRREQVGMLFASWTRGFKSGGYAVQVPSIAFAGPFDPERVETLEGGWRFTAPTGHWTAGVTIFDNRLRDLQRNVNKTNGGVLGNLVVNAAAARTRGVEMEILWRPDQRQTWQLSAMRLDARYDSYCANTGFPGGLSGIDRGPACGTTPGEVDNSDFPLATSPAWQATAGWRISIPLSRGRLEGSAQIAHTAALFTTDVPFPVSKREPMTLVDAGFGWWSADERWRLRLDLRNVGNQIATLQGIRSGNTLTVVAPTAPRTIMLSAGVDF